VRYFVWEGLTFEPEHPEALHQVELRSTSFRHVVEDVQRQQQVGTLPSTVDAGQLTFFLYMLGVSPYLLPQMAYLVTGFAPDNPNFRAGYERFVRDIVALLGNMSVMTP
jgi:hypothetical protein